MSFLSSCFHTMAYIVDLLAALYRFGSIHKAVLYVNLHNSSFYLERYEKKLKEYINNGFI